MSETLITTAFVKASVATTIKEITEYLKKNYSKHKALNELSITNDDLVASIAKLMQVKTLYSGSDRSVNLFDFFQKPKLMFEQECVGTIEHINQLEDIGNIVFRGTVGQGKSIFMRSLVIQDLINNNRIPVFIELKNVSNSKSVIDLVKDYLSIWIGGDESIFNIVLKSGKVSIFLDAFDEIDSDLAQNAYSEIDTLSQSYNKLKIIVSSRPDTIITNNPLFTVFSLKPYEEEEQEDLIRKLVLDPENIKLIIDAIHESNHEVKSVLTTPLMVVLFIRQYHVGFSIPKHVSDFYKNIFNVVTFTHDRSKGIEKRKSFSSLSQDQLEMVFERFCFETFLLKKTIFSKDEFIDLLKKSIEKNNILDFTDFNNLIFDYTGFACLILQDGNNYTFIHKSIQEFYVANFIGKLPQEAAEQVIEKKLFVSSNNSGYLGFLKVLKPYYYYKYYILNGLEAYKNKLDMDFINNDENIKKFVGVFYECATMHGKDNKILGILFINSSFIDLCGELILLLLSKFKEKEIIKESHHFRAVYEGDISEREILLISKYPDLYKIHELGFVWELICDKYNYYIKEVEMIENLVSVNDLDI